MKEDERQTSGKSWTHCSEQHNGTVASVCYLVTAMRSSMKPRLSSHVMSREKAKRAPPTHVHTALADSCLRRAQVHQFDPCHTTSPAARTSATRRERVTLGPQLVHTRQTRLCAKHTPGERSCGGPAQQQPVYFRGVDYGINRAANCPHSLNSTISVTIRRHIQRCHWVAGLLVLILGRVAIFHVRRPPCTTHQEDLEELRSIQSEPVFPSSSPSCPYLLHVPFTHLAALLCTFYNFRTSTSTSGSHTATAYSNIGRTIVPYAFSFTSQLTLFSTLPNIPRVLLPFATSLSTGFSHLRSPCNTIPRYSAASSISISAQSAHASAKLGVSPEMIFMGPLYQFPATKTNKSMLKFQHSWLQKWNWLAYSKNSNGGFCKYCVLFASDCVGKGYHQTTGTFVGSPFRRWKVAAEKFEHHSKAGYHKTCVLAPENFLKVYRMRHLKQATLINHPLVKIEENSLDKCLGGRYIRVACFKCLTQYTGKQEDVATPFWTTKDGKKKKSITALKPIVETIIFCGENELPLRGDDSGPIPLENPQKNMENSGLFSGTRHRHLTHCSRNATYVSPEIQNEVIGICRKLIQKKIISEIKNAECFAILGDETLDVSGQEQFSLCIREISNEDHPVLREDFVAFFQYIKHFCGEYIAGKISKLCGDLGLEMTKLVGQGYNGAANISGSLSDVKTRMQEMYPKSLSVPSVTNALGVVKQTATLFQFNYQAASVLKNNIAKLLLDSKNARLLGLCEIRYVERHEAVNTFVELLPAIVPSLQNLSQCNRIFSSTAASLLAVTEKGNFIVALFFVSIYFASLFHCLHICTTHSMILLSAISYCENIQKMFQSSRANDNDDHKQFAEIFLKSVTTTDNLFGTYRDRLKCRPRRIIIPTNLLNSTISDLFFCLDILLALEIFLPKHAHENCVKELKKLRANFSGCNSTCSKRLTGLALMSIHYPLPFIAEDILDVMVRKPNRRMFVGVCHTPGPRPFPTSPTNSPKFTAAPHECSRAQARVPCGCLCAPVMRIGEVLRWWKPARNLCVALPKANHPSPSQSDVSWDYSFLCHRFSIFRHLAKMATNS
ncbi:hypothetical protein PR048_002687 [Dryococelus australis]|uniref:TTF-type domain-containing protein n=1 Tax=Dryococelus australis TaxID=614101 RepID=A0ABQ9IL03_9NEOP|nr:hypothetical protein PR048_002687 [Dryococelus australis]